MKKTLTPFLIAASFVLAQSSSHAQTLEELLVDKGVISQEEVNKTKGGHSSVMGLDFSLGGKFEFEYVDNEADSMDGHFSLDVLEIYPMAVSKSGIIFKAEIVGEQAGTVVEEAHVTIPDLLPGRTYLKIGKEDRFIKRSRKTETYPISGSQFWRDDVEGIWLHGGAANFYWDASYTNSYELSSRSTIEEKVKEATGTKDISILHDNRAKGDKNSRKEGGIGIGYKFKGESQTFDAMAFYYDGKVGNMSGDAADLGIITDDDRDIKGWRVSYSVKKFSLVAELIDASYGDFETTVAYVEPSYKFSFDGPRYFKGLEVVARYNKSDPDVTRDITKPLTWGLTQTTVALIASLDKTVKVLAEYNKVDEDNDGKEVDNDEVLVQVQYKF